MEDEVRSGESDDHFGSEVFVRKFMIAVEDIEASEGWEEKGDVVEDREDIGKFGHWGVGEMILIRCEEKLFWIKSLRIIRILIYI